MAVRARTPASFVLIGHRRRRFRLGCAHLLHLAVVAAVGKVNHQPNYQPDDEPCPGLPAQAEHHQQRYGDAHNWSERNPWSHERARYISSTRPENPNSGADDHESEQRADRNQGTENIDWS